MKRYSEKQRRADSTITIFEADRDPAKMKRFMRYLEWLDSAMEGAGCYFGKADEGSTDEFDRHIAGDR